MDRIWFLLYNILAVPAQYLLFSFARFFHRKVREGVAGRKGEIKRLRKNLSVIDPSRRKVLFHCASVGEWEQARPVISAMRERFPDICVVVMFFSSSGYNYLQDSTEVDIKVYMPFDGYFRARRFLKLISPDIWFVVKHDIWPNHAYAARHLRIFSVLIDASMPPESMRKSSFLGGFNRSVYKTFDYIFPASEDERNRFLEIFPFPDRLFVCGDTRFDQVYLRGMHAKMNAGDPLFDEQEGSVFIAGSIWPSDERHLMPALLRLLSETKHLKLILVPHEPVEEHLTGIEQALRCESIESRRLTEVRKTGRNDTNIVVVDTLGMLASLYVHADIAYVGGSFGPGVHNIMEPAVLELPVLFGPKHTNSHEARQLADAGGAFPVNSESEIYKMLKKLLQDSDFRNKSGKEAGRLIMDNLGATEIIINKLSEINNAFSAEHAEVN